MMFHISLTNSDEECSCMHANSSHADHTIICILDINTFFPQVRTAFGYTQYSTLVRVCKGYGAISGLPFKHTLTFFASDE